VQKIKKIQAKSTIFAFNFFFEGEWSDFETKRFLDSSREGLSIFCEPFFPKTNVPKYTNKQSRF